MEENESCPIVDVLACIAASEMRIGDEDPQKRYSIFAARATRCATDGTRGAARLRVLPDQGADLMQQSNDRVHRSRHGCVGDSSWKFDVESRAMTRRIIERDQ